MWTACQASIVNKNRSNSDTLVGDRMIDVSEICLIICANTFEYKTLFHGMNSL